MKTIRKYTISLLKTGIVLCLVLLPCLSHATENNTQEANRTTEQNTDIIHSQNTEKSPINSQANPPVLSSQANQDKAEDKPMFEQEEIPAFTWGNYFNALGIMLLLLLVFWYILKIVKRYGNGKFLPNQKPLPRDCMYLEGQIPLGQGKSIVIVKVLDERLVLGVTEHNINLLTKTGLENEQDHEQNLQYSEKNTGKRFEELLEQA